ncbi:toprim domain-containing protein [Emticicia oligotrophica]|uniref:toprim domain-containing protein n=1 Tax=Emticicia oligotrophica TaxID=312279 RepID=UPI00273BDBE9|nr:toprim domain-containing protein [Emticicia oligotrophica]
MENTTVSAAEKIRQAKFEINLVDYAERQGYQVNKQKSTATDVILQKNIGQENFDTIGVRYYPETGYKYWTAMDSSDRGSLLDFEKNKNHLDLSSAAGKRELYQKIDEFLGNPPTQQSVKVKAISKKAETEKRLTDRELNLLPLTDTRYLEGRGITEKTYRSPEFQYQVYNEKVVLSAGNYPSKTYTNTVFPIRNEEILLAKIRRNDEELGYRGGQFNRIQEKRENGIHTSNFPKQQLDKLYLIESPIDAMSYFELKYAEIRSKNLQVAFISTVGNPSNSAYNTIQKFINASEPKQIVSLMDNDRAGKVFTINLLGRLSKPENDLSNNIKAEINVSQKTEVTLSINFSYDTDEKRRAMANNLKEYLIDPLKNNVAEGSEAVVKVLTITKSTHNAQIEIKFPYDNANLLTVEKGLIQLKGLTNEFCLEHPIQKDWNDELKRQKPFVVAVEKQGVELPEKRFSQGVEAFSYAEQRSAAQQSLQQKQTVKLYLEKYNLSHEVDKPQVFAIIKQGEIEEINPILKQEVEKQQRYLLLQRTLQEEKLLALQLSKELFPTNDCVIVKTTHQVSTHQHFIEFQKIQSDEKLENFAGIDRHFQEKINISDSQNFVITFNQNTNSVHLMMLRLKESTQIDKDFIEKNKGYLAEKSTPEKEEILKKDLESQCGELLVSDKKGAIIATADYNVSIENGKPIIHKIENFEFDKINREGLDIGLIKNDLADGLSKNAIDDFVFTQKKEDNSMEVGI